MSVSPLLGSAKPQYFDTTTGDFLVGGYIEFYSGGTSNPLDTYTTTVGNITNANPIYLNARGEPDNQIHGTDGVSYKVILKDSTGTVIWTQDTLYSANSTGADTAVTVLEAKLYLNDIAPKVSAYTVRITDEGKMIDCTGGSFTVLMLPVATAGRGFEVTIYNSGSGTTVVTGSGSEQINGGASLVLESGVWATLVTNGTYWKAVVATNQAVSATQLYLNETTQKTTTYAALINDEGALIDCTTNTFTVTLLDIATAVEGHEITVRNSGTGIITVAGNGGETIDSANTYILYPASWATFVSTGSEWNVISPNPSVTATGFTKISDVYFTTDAPTTGFDIDAVIGSVFESVGPTGSSATNIWTELDNLDPNAIAILLRFNNEITVIGGAAAHKSQVYARKTGSSDAIGSPTEVSATYSNHVAGNDEHKTVTEAWVILDSNVRFDLALVLTSAPTVVVSMHIVGFAV